MPQTDRDRLTNIRLTFTQKDISPFQIYKEILLISLRSFGTQIHQLDLFHQKFAKDKGWLSPSQFRQIRDLCWALPGPTTIQFLVSMTMLMTKSPLAGFTSFVIFSIPSLVVLSICGWLVSKYVDADTQFPTQLILLFLGFVASSAALITHSFIQNFKQHYRNPAKLIIMTSSALIFLKFQSITSISFCLVTGAIISLYMEIESKKKMSSKSENLLRDSHFNWFFGKNALFILIGIYCFLWVWFKIYSDSIYIYIEVFYFVGCFIFGPINTIFAYFYANFIELNLISENQFWIGVPFAFLLPGSILNIGIYFGSMIDGIRGTILSALFLYLPCFLSLCGILPQWRYYRDKSGIQRLITGINCVTTGLTFSIVLMALAHSIKIDESITICIYILSFFLIQFWGIYSIFIVLIGGLLANMRRWGLIYYRFMPDQIYT